MNDLNRDDPVLIDGRIPAKFTSYVSGRFSVLAIVELDQNFLVQGTFGRTEKECCVTSLLVHPENLYPPMPTSHNLTIAPWAARHWLSYWFTHRHTGAPGHSPDQARRHTRYWLTTLRGIDT